MNYILFDGDSRKNLLPFTYTRPVADLRIGILTIREKWEKFLGSQINSTLTEDYLSGKWPLHIEGENIFLNASIIPNEKLVAAVQNLKQNQKLVAQGVIVAYASKEKVDSLEFFETVQENLDIFKISNTWDLFSLNGRAIQEDFELLTAGRKSQPIPESNYIKDSANIFIEEGAEVENCSLNAAAGPIYIAKNSVVMEGSLIRGPFSLGEEATVKLGAKIYGPTSIGPNCRAGGEINNSVLFQNSNKGHDGFLGNSVLGEWCNIGADSNNSNLKNNYAEVRLWNYNSENFARTGLQFCGLMMGDHSKCGINTMFNTGTVIGVSANIFGSGFPRNFVPSFSWGGSAGMTTYKMDKVLETAKIVLERRGMLMSSEDEKILNHVFEETAKWRKS